MSHSARRLSDGQGRSAFLLPARLRRPALPGPPLRRRVLPPPGHPHELPRPPWRQKSKKNKRTADRGYGEGPVTLGRGAGKAGEGRARRRRRRAGAQRPSPPPGPAAARGEASPLMTITVATGQRGAPRAVPGRGGGAGAGGKALLGPPQPQRVMRSSGRRPKLPGRGGNAWTLVAALGGARPAAPALPASAPTPLPPQARRRRRHLTTGPSQQTSAAPRLRPAAANQGRCPPPIPDVAEPRRAEQGGYRVSACRSANKN